jgi:hypothetical protein
MNHPSEEQVDEIDQAVQAISILVTFLNSFSVVWEAAKQSAEAIDNLLQAILIPQ